MLLIREVTIYANLPDPFLNVLFFDTAAKNSECSGVVLILYLVNYLVHYSSVH